MLKTRVLLGLLSIIAGVLSACPPSLPGGTRTWSSQPSWNTANAAVNIPKGSSVILDKSPANALGVITVSGDLYIYDASLELITKGIVLEAGGTLTIGTADCPITKKVIITLTAGGNLGQDSYDGTHLGTKGIVAKWNSRLRINGYVSGPSWTRLADNALRGSSKIMLQESVKWAVNDVILITSTDFSEVLDKKDARYSNKTIFGKMWGNAVFPDQHETRTVVSISSDGKTITLNAGLNYTHWGTGYQRAEVGLLSRRVVIRGDASSDKDMIGGHFMLRYGKHSVSGLELTRMGQQGISGRYPLHFHMARFLWGMDVSVSHSSVHNCYQRCYVIHETHGVTLEDNVAYNSYGHCYFLEDGGEHGNAFIHNLGARILPTYLLPSDNEPSMFWISHPNNSFIDNASSGAYIGYWFVMPVMPVRLSAKFWTDPSIMNPRRTQLPKDGPRTGFRGNVVHSNYQDGVQCSSMEDADGKMNPGTWKPTTGPPFKNDVPSIISGFIIYKSRSTGIWSRGCAPATWRDMIIADTGRGIDLINGQAVINSTFIGRSDNKGLPNTKTGLSVPDHDGRVQPVGGIIHYDVGVGLVAVNCTFYNFKDPNISYGAWGGSTNGPGWNSSPYWLSLGMKMYNSNPVAFPVWPYANGFRYPMQADAIQDDGGLTGIKGGGWLMGYTPGLDHISGCVYHDEYPGYQCPWFNYGWAHVNTSLGISPKFVIEQADRTVYKFNYMNRTSKASPWLASNGVGLVPLGRPITELFTMQNLRYSDIYQGVINGQYELILANTNNGTLYQSPGELMLNYIPGSVKASMWNIYAIAYPKGTTFNIQLVTTYMYSGEIGRMNLNKVNSFKELNWDSYYYNDNTQKLYVLLSSDFEQDYSNAGGPGWSFRTAPNLYGRLLHVKPSCAFNCKRSGKATIAPVEALPTSLEHDIYKAALTGANNKVGTAWFQMYHNYRNRNPRLSYQLYHNLVDPNITACISVKKTCVSSKLMDVILGGNHLIPLTRQLWLQVSSGQTQIMIQNKKGDILLLGDILLTETKDSKVWIPSNNAPAPSCTPSYETLSIYKGAFAAGTRDGYAPNGFITEDKTNPLCDGASMSIRFLVQFFEGLKNLNMNVPSKFVSLEFFAKSKDSTPVELQISTSQDVKGKSTRTRQYSQDWIITGDKWTFFRVPLSAFGAEKNLPGLYFRISNEERLYYPRDAVVLLSAVRLSTQPATLFTDFTRTDYKGKLFNGQTPLPAFKKN